MIEGAGALELVNVIGAFCSRFLLTGCGLAQFLLLCLLERRNALLVPAGEDAIHVAQAQLTFCIYAALICFAQ